MGRILKLFACRSFSILLFHLGLLFFAWPIITIPTEQGGAAIFNYIFIVWAILVFVLILVGTSIRSTLPQKKDTDDV